MKFVTRIILIGIGPHSKRVYLPALHQLKQKFGVEISLAIDVKSEAEKVRHHFENTIIKSIHYLLTRLQDNCQVL